MIAPAPLPPRMPDGRAWPRITVVTPSMNQGRYIEETIRSVLDQGYPNLEYIVMDGGSSDDTVTILERYSSSLSYWVSESDGGQSDAIARGFTRATGDLLAWLCADDLYLPGALEFAATMFVRHPQAPIICGETRLDQGSGWEDWMAMRFADAVPTYTRLLGYGQCVQQPGCFWPAAAYRRTSGVDPALQFCMDYDILVKLSALGTPVYRPREIAWLRSHPTSKSSTMHAVRVAERAAIVERALGERPVPRWRLCAANYAALIRHAWRNDRESAAWKAARIARLGLGFARRAARGDVQAWHPIHGYRDANRVVAS